MLGLLNAQENAKYRCILKRYIRKNGVLGVNDLPTALLQKLYQRIKNKNDVTK